MATRAVVGPDASQSGITGLTPQTWSAGALVLSVWLMGCSTPYSEPIARFTLVFREQPQANVEVLRANVTEMDCVSETILHTLYREIRWLRRAPVPATNYSRAIAKAINSVPDANIMTDIELKVRHRAYLVWEQVCGSVTGNVGRIEELP